jgi:uncharacterized membrane protein
MNEAHLHMVVNHFPIIGTIFGFGILIVGLIRKDITIRNVSYFIFVIAALFAAVSMATGDGAEEMVEDMPNIGRQIIHEHEEIAEKLAIVLYLLGLTSIVSLFFNRKNNPKERIISFAILTIAAIGMFLAQQTGTTGGEIRHTEIRSNNSNNLDKNNSLEHEED